MGINIDLTGRTAVVTGGAKGIGRECSLALAKAGATVIVNFSRPGNEAEALVDEIAGNGARQRHIRQIFHSPSRSRPCLIISKKDTAGSIYL